jgi:hypothetical protein
MKLKFSILILFIFFAGSALFYFSGIAPSKSHLSNPPELIVWTNVSENSCDKYLNQFPVNGGERFIIGIFVEELLKSFQLSSYFKENSCSNEVGSLKLATGKQELISGEIGIELRINYECDAPLPYYTVYWQTFNGEITDENHVSSAPSRQPEKISFAQDLNKMRQAVSRSAYRHPKEFQINCLNTTQ